MISPPAFNILSRAFFCYMKGTYLNLGNVENSQIVSDSSNHNGDLFGTISFHFPDQSGQRHRWTIDLRHAQSPQNDSIRLSICSSSKEFVQLDKLGEIYILRFWASPSDLTILFMLDINSHVC